MKKVKMIQIQNLEPECPKCTGSNAMLNEHINKLKCRDCGYTVEEKDVEIEVITMEEGQSRLKKYGSLFPWKEVVEIPERFMKKIDKQIKENNKSVTMMFKVSKEEGRKAGLEADAKLKKLFKDLRVNSAEYAEQKIKEIKLVPLESQKVKRARDLKLGDIIDNGSCGKRLNITLIAKRPYHWEEKEYHIVLCLFPQKQEYITWWMDPEGETTAGHYFLSFNNAVKDYKERG